MKMQLIMESWRRFLKEADTVTAPPWEVGRQTVREPRLRPMDPRDVKTPVVRGTREEEEKEMPQVEPSGEVQEHNANELFKYFQDDHRTRNVFVKGWAPNRGWRAPDAASVSGFPASKLFKQQAKQYINYMVVNNPIFQKDKIVGYLGAGSYGFVVQLDNDHALKVYIGSFEPTTRGTDPSAKSDIERYERSASKAFDEKTGAAGDLHIYDQGEIETPFGRKWFYAEMQQLRTLSDYMRYVHKDKDEREVTDGVDYEITFLKELAHLATLVDKHGAQAIAEFDPEEAYAKQHGRAFPEEHEDEIKLDPDFGISIDSHPRGDEPTQLAEFAELLERGNLDAIFETTGYKGRSKLFLLDKTYAKNLFKQLKELLKTKTLRDIRDIRGANIGISTQDESLPIIFDF